MPIYTRTGDKGKTTLANRKKMSKADLRIEALGTIDELNSMIGVVLSVTSNKRQEIRSELIEIQNDLLKIGSNLANPQVTRPPASSLAGEVGRGNQKLAVSSLSKRVKEFEGFIDEMTQQMPKLSNFILPGGGKTGAMLHLARAVCRRTERRIVEFNSKKKIDDNIIIYLNRLSDLLFTMARFANFQEKKKEVIWPA